MFQGFATNQATFPNYLANGSPFMETGDCTRGAALLIHPMRLRQWNRREVQSGLTIEDNNWFSSQFWESSQSSVVRFRLGQVDRIERPRSSSEGEGVRRSIRLHDLEA